MTLLADITRTARRPGIGSVWQCFWCWQRIKKYETYREQRYTDDGSVVTVRGHPECYDANDLSGRDPDEPIYEPKPRGKVPI